MSPHTPAAQLAIVGGRPGSGKTTLAAQLAERLHRPLIARDALNSAMRESYSLAGLQPTKEEVATTTYAVFFDTIQFLLARRVSLIAEAAFQHRLWYPRLQSLLEVADLRIIHCVADDAVVAERIALRRNQKTEGEPKTPTIVKLTDFEPVDLEVPTMLLDTNEGYTPPIESVLAFLRSRQEV